MELTDHTDLLQMAFDTAPTGTAVEREQRSIEISVVVQGWLREKN